MAAKQHDYRTLSSLRKCSQLPSRRPTKERLGSQHSPLFHVEPENVVIDELHLLLRISDILVRNLILEMVRLDKKDKVMQAGDQQHLRDFVKAIRSCGLTFDVWETRDGDGKPQGRYDWTALTGRERKQLIEKLPSKLRVLLPEEVGGSVISLWNVSCTRVK